MPSPVAIRAAGREPFSSSYLGHSLQADFEEATAEAEELVAYLLSDEGQRFYTDTAEEAEYPLVAGIPAKEGLPALDTLRGPDVDLSSFGAELESTLELLRQTGYLS